MWTSVLSKPDVQDVYAFPPALFANRELADPKFIPRLLMTKGRAEPTYAHLFPLSKKPGSNTMVLVKKTYPLLCSKKVPSHIPWASSPSLPAQIPTKLFHDTHPFSKFYAHQNMDRLLFSPKSKAKPVMYTSSFLLPSYREP